MQPAAPNNKEELTLPEFKSMERSAACVPVTFGSDPGYQTLHQLHGEGDDQQRDGQLHVGQVRKEGQP